ncbi:FtsB family cell division protein [Evansella tamaricis]|uniref:Septum formation initiator family protein n=1 Tax=Evansella tamaricis TaxID=2069301 RepID=A0ABS6J905_9BACI|nr:septum formation initiator family protein [Evansella tamaricis]MBU9710174.1 septum formation initiator family protein [Evansella tamaricis]
MEKGHRSNVRKLSSDYMNRQVLLQEHKVRRRKGLIRRLTVFGFVFIMILTFAGVTMFNQNAILAELNGKKSDLENELLYLQEQERNLAEEIDLLQDPEYIAEIARRDFFLTKPGETLFQLPRSSQSSD